MTITGNTRRWVAPPRISGFLVVAPPVAGLMILCGVFFALVPPVIAVGLAVWIATARPVALLLRLAASPSEGRRPGFRLAMSLLATGSLLAAASAAGAGIAELASPETRVMEVRLPVEIPNVGLCLAALAYVSGLLILPGTTPTLTARLRRVLDGASVCVCVLFSVWVPVFSQGQLPGAALTATLVASVTIGVAAVAGLRTARRNWLSLTVGLGVIASVAGLGCLTITLDFGASSTALFAAGALLVAGPTLLGTGAADLARQPHRAGPLDGNGSFSTYPLLAIPLAAGILVATHHALNRGSFDGASITLAITAVSLVAVREALAALDVRRYARRLAAQKAHFRSLFAGSSDITLILDDDQIVRWQSPAAARLLGLSDQEVVGKALLALLHPSDACELASRMAAIVATGSTEAIVLGEARIRDGFGGWRDVEVRLADRRAAGEVGALVANVRDISDRRQLERSLRHAAFADQLTSLPNRRELIRMIAGLSEPSVIVVFCLDGIEGINDMHGRAVTEAVLIEAARRLRDGVGREAHPFRLEGDRFAVVSSSGAIQSQIMATRLLSTFAQPYELPGATAFVSARAGLAELDSGPDAPADADEGLRCAELALRRAKHRGRGGAVEWHDASMEAAVRRQMTIEQYLPEAIARGELELRFQPIIDLARSRPVGAEALVSWRHPDLGVADTEELLSCAEEIGLGPEFHEWMVHRVCRNLSAWRRDSPDLWISLDVCAEQLTSPELVSAIVIALETHEVPAANLVIELAEAGLRSPGRPARGRGAETFDPAADARSESIITSLTELRSLGVRVALDHFGTETTSLRRLRLLPVDLLKVDRGLFMDPPELAGHAAALIDVMVKFGHQLGVDVAVQGLTDQLDVTSAKAAGCRYGQGTPFSEPVPAEYFEAYLDSHRAHRLF
ncbi:MAG: EAL domain-containing protein [Micromonosporaceae bacterium]|nr:EAL domain-containing protein [Micromonosporaceae bacterium]